jgi:hypothetical protein
VSAFPVPSGAYLARGPVLDRNDKGPGIDPGPVTWADVAGTPNGIRTRVATLRGWCPRPLDDGGVQGGRDSIARPPEPLKPGSAELSAGSSVRGPAAAAEPNGPDAPPAPVGAPPGSRTTGTGGGQGEIGWPARRTRNQR